MCCFVIREVGWDDSHQQGWKSSLAEPSFPQRFPGHLILISNKTYFSLYWSSDRFLSVFFIRPLGKAFLQTLEERSSYVPRSLPHRLSWGIWSDPLTYDSIPSVNERLDVKNGHRAKTEVNLLMNINQVASKPEWFWYRHWFHGSMVDRGHLPLSDIDIFCPPFQVSRWASLAERRISDKELWISTDGRLPRMQTWGEEKGQFLTDTQLLDLWCVCVCVRGVFSDPGSVA